MIPIFRAKKIDSDEYVIGWYSSPIIIEGKTYLSITNKDGEYRIDTTTLSIHFPNMLDSQGNEIFASLQEYGKGGDLVVSKSYPFYGDAPEIRDSSGKCEELNYKGLLFFGSNGCSLDYIRVSERVRGCAVGYIVEDFNEYKIVGVQEWEKKE